MWLSLFLISALATIWSSTVSAAPDKIVCYHGTWANWRPGNGRFTVADIDTNLCTHVNYAFVGINSDGSISTNADDPGFLAAYRNLKSRNPRPKLLIAIGGWNEGSVDFSQVAANPTSRSRLLTSALNLIDQYCFDGFDFDWEYPGDRGGGANDKNNFVTLLSEFRTVFNQRGLLLSAAVSASTSYYNVPGIARYLDFINVMTYDFHGPWESVTGENSPYPDSINSINSWISAGAPANKLNLGIGTYGHSYTLQNPSNNGIGAPVTGAGLAGPYTQEAGSLGYNEICEKLGTGWTRRWINNQRVPYAYSGNQWVGYDDVDSIAEKARFAVSNNLGGIMIWSIETDDFRGTCGTRYPLLNAIKSGLSLQISGPGGRQCRGGSGSGSGSDSGSGSESGSGSGSGTGSGSVRCLTQGYIRDPTDCSKYYYCQLNGNSYIIFSFQCGGGLYYDTRLGVCNWPNQVPCP